MVGSGQKEVENEGHRIKKKGKKGRNMILFTSCKGPSLDRIRQFPTDSKQPIMLSRKTDVSHGTGMYLNIILKTYI